MANKKLFERSKFYLVLLLGCVILSLLFLAFCSEEKKNEESSKKMWILNDSSTSNITSFDPVRIVDAFSINVLANVYEGLVNMNFEGDIVPGIAESWNISEDGKVWTFKIKKGVKFHPAKDCEKFTLPLEVTSEDVVYSISRTIKEKVSLYKWQFIDLIEGAKEFADGKVDNIRGLRATDIYTVEIHLTQPFPLLNRLVMVGSWIYPKKIIESCGSEYLTNHEIGTGPYMLERFIPDDRIILKKFNNYNENQFITSPDQVVVKIFPDSIAALEAFKKGELDVIDVGLDIFKSANALAEKEGHLIQNNTANSLDYLVLNNQTEPFDDVRVRKAIAYALNREDLAKLLSETVVPAFGFIPVPSKFYRGLQNIKTAGFQFDPSKASDYINAYLKEKKLSKLELELVIDSGELPETIGQFVKDSLERFLPIKVRLKKITWPEMLQMAFGGSGKFYRFWWNVVTPGEDVYFLFYFPGQNPPNGFNMSFYNSKAFLDTYHRAFNIIDFQMRKVEIEKLENIMIQDAAAVPLFHKKYFFLVRKEIQLPVNSFLRKFYWKACRLK